MCSPRHHHLASNVIILKWETKQAKPAHAYAVMERRVDSFPTCTVPYLLNFSTRFLKFSKRHIWGSRP
jgi:hypothetical protein